MSLTYQSAGEPRFGLTPFFVTTQEFASPSGLTNTSTQSRTVTLATPHDPLSLLTEVTELNVNGQTFTTVIDTELMTTTTTSPEGRTTVRTFDNKARVTRFSQDSNIADRLTIYDSFGRISKLEQGNQSITYGYDSLGRLSTSENALGEQTGMEYDDANRRSAIILPSGRAFRYDYDLAGNLISVEMPNGAIHEIGYTAINLLSSYTPAGNANSLVSEFNTDRQRTAGTQPGSRRIEYFHDPSLGRSTGISYPEADVAFTYADATNRAATINWTPTNLSPGQSLAYFYDGIMLTGTSFDGAASGDYTYRYDNNYQLVGRTLDGGTERPLTYDNDNLLTGFGPFSITRNGPAGRPGVLSDGALSVTYGFNSEARLAERKYQVIATEFYDLGLTYDAAGKITQEIEVVAGVSGMYDYIYDLDGQLLEVHLDGLLEERYEYDVNGNRTLREIAGAAETTTYDAQDRIQSHGGLVYSIDQDGFLTQRGTTAFEYGTRGELLRVTIAPGNEIQYVYDGFGRRVARTDNAGTTQYLYGNPGNQLLLTEIRAPDTTLTQYFYDESGVLIAMDRAGTRYYIGTDQVGSPRIVTDAIGSVIKRIAYDSWGVQIEDSNPTFSMPFGFAGGLLDTATGLVRFGFRDYDPLVGRWMARDPILYQSGQANLYVYANNDPVNFRDPSGLICVGWQAYAGFGAGLTLCYDKGNFSACAEVGLGIGGGLTADTGPLASVADSTYSEISAGVQCGPLSVGVGFKLDSCGDVSCKFEVTFKIWTGDVCSGAVKAGISSPPTKPGCNFGAKVASGACYTGKI